MNLLEQEEKLEKLREFFEKAIKCENFVIGCIDEKSHADFVCFAQNNYKMIGFLQVIASDITSQMVKGFSVKEAYDIEPYTEGC